MTSSTIDTETATMLRLLAEPAQIGEHIGQQIERAARRCRLNAVRVRKLWYGQAKVSGEDLAAILRALARTDDLVVAYMDVQTQLAQARLRSAGASPP